MLRENPRVCVEVDEYDRDGRGSWRSVIAQGVSEELSGDAIEAALALLRERFARASGREAEREAARAGRRRPPHPARGRVRAGRRALTHSIFPRKQGMRVCSEIENHRVWEWTPVQGRSITRTGDRDTCGVPAYPVARRPPNPAALPRAKGIELSETIHLHDLSPAERLLEESAERGFVEEKDIQAFADEHELTEDDLAALRTALEERDVIVREEAREETRAPVAAASRGRSTRCSSSWTRPAGTSS